MVNVSQMPSADLFIHGASFSRTTERSARLAASLLPIVLEHLDDADLAALISSMAVSRDPIEE